MLLVVGTTQLGHFPRFLQVFLSLGARQGSDHSHNPESEEHQFQYQSLFGMSNYYLYRTSS